MIAPLPPADRRRLLGVLALLDSPEPAERDAAGLAACRLIAARGLSWDAVLVDPPARSGDWRRDLAVAQRHQEHLAEWPLLFTAKIERQRTLPNLADRLKLAKIVADLRHRGLM